jgi:hypothetical protein
MGSLEDVKEGLSVAAYYESTDGLHWSAPALGQIESRGSRNNNYVAVTELNARPEYSIYDALAADRKARYKGFTLRPLFDLKDPKAKLEWELQPIVSDGVTWKRLDVPGLPSGDESNLSFDAVEKQFIATIKHTGPYGRSVFLSTSPDFRHWSRQELIFHADDLDQQFGRRSIAWVLADPRWRRPSLDIPATYNVDVYNMGTFRYEGLYLGMPAMILARIVAPFAWQCCGAMALFPWMAGKKKGLCSPSPSCFPKGNCT